MARPSPYPPELRRRAVRMVAEVRPDYPSEWSAMKAVAAKLGVTSTETVRSWVRRAEVDAGDEDPEGGGGFLRGRARPATQVLIAFIDAFRKVYGVEPICRVLSAHGTKIAPSTYYAAKSRPASPRAVSLSPPSQSSRPRAVSASLMATPTAPARWS